MKITMCAYDAPNNIDGPTTWIKRLLPFLRENGVETRLIFIAGKRKDLSTLLYFQKLNFACKLIPAELFFEEQIRAILSDINTHPPDIFIPNYFPVACYANQWISSTGIPSVLILHNDDDRHHSLVDEFVVGEPNKRVSVVVTVSKSMHRKVEVKHPIDAKVICIPYGAPLTKTLSQFSADKNLKLMYLGRLNEAQKRISDVAKGFCKIVKTVPGTEAVIYGKGASLSSVLSIIQQEGKGFPVHYGGTLPVSEVQNYLAANHVFVLLSNYEGIPIALMEAMACGLVPICSDIESGIPEIITHGKNGFIIKDRDGELVKTVQLLREQPKVWQELSKAARATIENGYSEETNNKKWLHLFQELAVTNRRTKDFVIPPIEVLQKEKYKPDLLSNETLIPSQMMIPVIRFKKFIGRIKRRYIKS